MKAFLLLPIVFGIAACQAQPARKAAPAASATTDTVVFSEKTYNAAPFGLSMRDRPAAGGAVIYKISYGAEIAPVRQEPDGPPVNSGTDTISIDGMRTSWVKVQAGGKTGYVTDAYVSDYAPPPMGTAGIKEWVGAIARPYGKPFYGKPKVQTLYQDGVAVFRQLYNNGAVYTEGQGYEYSYQSLQLPSTGILKVYNCIKGLKDFEEVFKANTTLRRGKYKIPGKGTDDGYDWDVEYQTEGDTSWIKSITIGWSGGGYSTLSITSTEGDIVVIFSSGVQNNKARQ